MGIDKELLDKPLGDYKGPEDLIGEQGLPRQLTKALVEREMYAELTHHLGYEKHDVSDRGSGNSRNGTSRKKWKGDFGEAEIEVPRDRNGTFEPQIVPRHERPSCISSSPVRQLSRAQTLVCGVSSSAGGRH